MNEGNNTPRTERFAQLLKQLTEAELDALLQVCYSEFSVEVLKRCIS